MTRPHFRHAFLVQGLSLLSAFWCSGGAVGAGTPCVDNATVEKTALSPASAKHFYFECVPIADGNHPFMARLPAERRAAATQRLKDAASQTLACSAQPRDPARTGLQKKDMVVLASCKPPRVGEVWNLP